MGALHVRAVLQPQDSNQEPLISKTSLSANHSPVSTLHWYPAENEVTRAMATKATSDAPPAQPSTPRGQPRYLFLARFKATDVISGKQIEGLTTDLSEGGCCVLTRRGPFSPGTQVLLEIAKNDVALVAHATVIYNLRDQVMGLCFAEMEPGKYAILARWLAAAISSAQRSPGAGLLMSRRT
jgi:PilZ domain